MHVKDGLRLLAIRPVLTQHIIALAGTHNVLGLMTRWTPEDRLLFGSDFPYCRAEVVYNKEKLEKYEMSS